MLGKKRKLGRNKMKKKGKGERKKEIRKKGSVFFFLLIYGTHFR